MKNETFQPYPSRIFRILLMCALLVIQYSNGFAQGGHPIDGQVLDADDKSPLPGVNVRVKDTNTGTVTDAQGRFHLNVHKMAGLIFTYVGYETREIADPRDPKLTVELSKVNQGLTEVLVIGYGTSRKRDITGAVATFNAKGIEERPVTRVDQALIGQMPGVQIRQQTTMPGAGFSVQVRGSGSISAGTEPLYVIDGFPLDVVSQSASGGFTGNPLNNLNPNDIESIQVLKDAAAGAIYGSRAANGVVIITTKRGRVGKPQVALNAYAGVSRAARKLDVLSPEEWIEQATELANYKWVNSGAGRTASQTNDERRAILGLAPGAYNNNFMPDDRWTMPGHPGLEYVDWQDTAFRAAPFQNYQLSVSGGTDAVRYFFSGNYLNQEGVLINSGYKNYAARANIEVNATKRLKFGFNLAPTYSETNSPSAEGKDNQLMKLFNMAPIVEDTAGINSGAGKNSVYPWATSSVSPVAFLNHTINQNKTTRILYSMYGDYELLKGLAFRSTLNYDEANQNTKKYTSDFATGNPAQYLAQPGKNSSGSYSGYKKQNFVNENTLSYNHSIGTDHTISAVAGFSYNYVHIENFTLSTAGGFANDIVTTLNNAIPNTNGVTVTGNTTESNNALLSYYTRLQYGFRDKYLLSASIRRDGSSRFGSANKWGTFPSVSAGWRISEEPFMKRQSLFNDLKLRASWGRAGNYSIGDYATQALLTGANYSFGGNTPVTVTGQIPNGIPNPLLQWEMSNTYDAGFDASLLKSRVNIVFDVYERRNTRLLLNIPVPAASGFTSSLQNIGAVKNTGVELAVNTMNIVKRDFQWSTNANVAYNKNEVLSLGPDDAPINVSAAYSGNPAFLLQKGLPMYSFYLIKTIGTLTEADMADAKIAKLSGQTVGDAKYLDANKDGKIDANDRVVAGQPTPKFTWGITNTFKYKDFDLNVQVYGQTGGSIYSFLARAIDNPANGRATNLGVWRDRWTAANPNPNAPRGKIGLGYTIPLFTTDWLYSSNFVRIQNITLGYNLKRYLKSGFINNARVYATLQNWFSWDNYKGGVNPEAQNTNVSGSGSYPLPGDYGAMPLNKTVIVGVNVTF
ncbi:SusC/RagA family TonB-linked outer membrane protein [Chitinophaga agrisoli]|nr:TonB-dependent receptor [Chitinophaga agrisoli]